MLVSSAKTDDLLGVSGISQAAGGSPDDRVEARKSLLLLHRPGKAMPGDTARWLEPRTVNRHFHLRDLGRDEVDRIVRYVLQRELGLVLSGGGARTFAHVGVLRAIREAGLSVDFIIGVSMGAIIGRRQALSDDIEQMVPSLKKQMTRAFSDYTLPIVSLARGRRFDRCLSVLFEDAKIEDLWTPYSCVSSNLTKADTVIHRTGPMWRAIRASGGLPGLVPPVVDDGDLLYDGALMNNLPIDIIPGIVSILQRAGQLPSLHTRRLRLAAELADLYVRPRWSNSRSWISASRKPRSTSATSTGGRQSANGYQPVVDPRCAPGAALFSPDRARGLAPVGADSWTARRQALVKRGRNRLQVQTAEHSVVRAGHPDHIKASAGDSAPRLAG